MRYLKNVLAWIEEEKYKTEFDRLKGTLQEEGIAFWYLGHDNRENTSLLPDTYPSDWAGEKVSNCLWITDNSQQARALCAAGEAVLAFLHEGNANQDCSGVLYACEKPGDLDADYLEGIYRRYKGLPWDVLETDRCIVRETTEEDVEAFFQIYADPEITQYTEKLYPTIEEEKQYVREYREKIYGFYGFGVWTVLKKETGEVIGRVGFSYREGFEEPEIGFVIGMPWQRQGYAEEVCRSLLQYGEEELGFSCVQAFVMPDNAASVHLCEKLGLHKIDSVKIAGILYHRFKKIFNETKIDKTLNLQ